jgi:ATP synthase protein I
VSANNNENEKEKSVLRQVYEASTIGIQFALSIFGGLAFGYFLDRLFGTSYLKFVFLFFGILAGFWELFKVVKKQEGKDIGRSDSGNDKKDH